MGDQDFTAWAAEVGLGAKTIETLAKQDLCDMKALRVFNLDSVVPLKLTMGQAALLTDGLLKLQGKNPNIPPTGRKEGTEGDQQEATGSNSDSSSILAQLRADPVLRDAVNRATGADNVLADLLTRNNNPTGEAGIAVTPAHSTVFDPVYYLRPKVTSKYLDITDFISQRKGECEEVISSKEGVEIVIRGQDRVGRKVHLNSCSLTQWNIANINILYQLLLDGALAQTNVPDYLAYSVKILELSYHHEWESVLYYDREYRMKQAAYGFRWGTDPPHLGAAVLIPRSQAPKHFQKDNGARHKKSDNSRYKKLVTKKGEEICLGFNSRAGCRWGGACRFLHVCSERGCEEKHAQFDHPKG